MKSDGFQRSVRVGRHDRHAGDAPNMGRVSRMPGTGLPRGIRRRKRKSEGAQGNRIRQARARIITTWSVLLCLAVLGALGLTIWLWVRPQVRPQEKIAGPGAVEIPTERKVLSRFPSPSEGSALALVRAALALRDPAKAENYFRPCSTAPEAIIEFLKGLEKTDGIASHFEWLGSMDANGLSLDGVVIGFKGTDRPRNRLALLTPDEEGKWRIDFDAFARINDPVWSDFENSNIQFATLRVYVARDSYYNGPFSSDREWICYGIASPDVEGVMLAYCKIGTPQAIAMQWMLSKDSKMVRATIEIRRVAGAESRQFEISRVFAQDWVMGQGAFDDRFR